MNVLACVSVQQQGSLSRGKLQIGFNTHDKQRQFETILKESHDYLARHPATICRVDVLALFKKVLMMQSGSGTHIPVPK